MQSAKRHSNRQSQLLATATTARITYIRRSLMGQPTVSWAVGTRNTNRSEMVRTGQPATKSSVELPLGSRTELVSMAVRTNSITSSDKAQPPIMVRQMVVMVQRIIRQHQVMPPCPRRPTVSTLTIIRPCQSGARSHKARLKSTFHHAHRRHAVKALKVIQLLSWCRCPWRTGVDVRHRTGSIVGSRPATSRNTRTQSSLFY